MSQLAFPHGHNALMASLVLAMSSIGWNQAPARNESSAMAPTQATQTQSNEKEQQPPRIEQTYALAIWRAASVLDRNSH